MSTTPQLSDEARCMEIAISYAMDKATTGETREAFRALLAQRDQGGEAVARILHWEAPAHIPVPHGGICARTFAEFPLNAGEGKNGYWKEGAPLYTHPAPKEAPQPVPPNLKQIGWYSQTGHGNYFRETLDDSLKSLEFAGKPMWRPVYVISGEKPAQSERERFEAKFRGLDFTLTEDAWGRPVYKQTHVRAMFDGWKAALSGSAPTGEAK